MSVQEESKYGEIFTATEETPIGSLFAGVVDQLFSILSFLFPLIALIVVIRALISNIRYPTRRGWGRVAACAIIALVFPFALNFIKGTLKPLRENITETAPTPSDTSSTSTPWVEPSGRYEFITPEKSSDPPVTEPAPPPDMSWLPNTLIIVAGILGIVALIVILLWFVFLKIINPAREQRKRAQAVLEALEDGKKRLQAVVEEYASYDLDFEKALTYPAMHPVGEPLREVSDFLRSLKEARTAEIMTPEKPSTEEIATFLASVVECEESFKRAENTVQRVGWGYLSPDQQEKLKRAKTYLDQILSGDLWDTQVDAMWKQLDKHLEGIIRLSEPARLSIEARSGLLDLEGTQS